jgi:hypothetical protein
VVFNQKHLQTGEEMAQADRSIKQRVTVTGHNRESTGRVVHYLRPEQPAPGSPVELHGAVYITDDKGILEDGTQLEVTISVATVPKT